ncbi:hypothetical protein AcV7_006938 [Taiwanofungus camphoratus]|nr:hypothetical protein AcV7_006938 [Antrodia cinnamomea]
MIPLDQLDTLLEMKDKVNEIQKIALNDQHHKILNWLTQLDHSVHHNEVNAKQQRDTGNWFLDIDEYKSWQKTSNSILWLHGMTGCGKSVLCSAIIEDLKKKYEPQAAVVYFYFNFRDTEIQQYKKLLSSLIKQLILQHRAMLGKLEALYAQNHDGQQQPKPSDLAQLLDHIIADFTKSAQLFIVLDALEECEEKSIILQNFIKHLNDQKIDHLHILVTSRPDSDIDNYLAKTNACQVAMQTDKINLDIAAYVNTKLLGPGVYPITKHLLDDNVIVNVQVEDYGSAMQAACSGGHESIVQLLLDRGADVNVQGGHYGSVLQAACSGGYESIVQLLLDRGADATLE